MAGRTVTAVTRAQQAVEGGGFVVQRAFPTRTLDQVDPFLLLDEMGPAEVPPGRGKGAPDHPHRGFETVTYLLQGEMEHKDSAGNAGTLRAGDVQWMTAGDGVVHSEMPSAAFQARGGTMHGFQLWVNLPRAQKRVPPRYQDVSGSAFPEVPVPGGSVKVIAGELQGARAPVETRLPIAYFHVRLGPGGTAQLPLPKSSRAFVYLFEGAGRVGAERREARARELVQLGDEGDEVTLESTEGLQALVLAGPPLDEPVARYGPFVMNTEAELLEAIHDFRDGKMGAIR